MHTLEKVKYTVKAGVGGTGFGLALCGFLTFLPVSITSTAMVTITAATALLLSAYTFTNVE